MSGSHIVNQTSNSGDMPLTAAFVAATVAAKTLFLGADQAPPQSNTSCVFGLHNLSNLPTRTASYDLFN
jgi:hypothetical protein